HLVEDELSKTDAMAAAAVALACSGTVTTELALAGCPMVVGYRLSPLTHFLLKRLIRTPWVTLFNIAARRFIAPELIQDRCTGPALAAELALRLDDPALRAAQSAEQTAAIALMGPRDGDPAERAADAVLKVLAENAAR
ncbi:MAG: lpxB, partial [Brevundimonas sp.]|nr:lpxB [Brevundimonas sp.]